MCLEDDIRERIVNSEAFRRAMEACKQLAEAFIQLNETTREVVEKLAEQIAPLAATFADLVQDILETADLSIKTEPPRAIIRRLGCRPNTKAATAIRCNARNGCRHK